MLNELFANILTAETATFSLGGFLACTVCSLILGIGVAALSMYGSTYSKSFVVTLALLPVIVQMVIMLVNGNLGTGVAVMGAFSLVRFRSVPGTAREILSLFLAMAVGLATGTGYLAAAVLFVLIVGCIGLLLTASPFGEQRRGIRELHITIPENLDYSGIFEDLFEEYLTSWELEEVRTVNMGSLFKLTYQIVQKDAGNEKKLIDELRCRNGNLEISCARTGFGKEGL